MNMYDDLIKQKTSKNNCYRSTIISILTNLYTSNKSSSTNQSIRKEKHLDMELAYIQKIEETKTKP